MNPAKPTAPTSAVALRYAIGDAAPVVVAKGRGVVAEEIMRRAREAGVFVHDSRELTALLMQVDLDARIPPALYVAVAELLAWLARVDAGRAACEGGGDAVADR
jgi:flagellar biosynthesis protein